MIGPCVGGVKVHNVAEMTRGGRVPGRGSTSARLRLRSTLLGTSSYLCLALLLAEPAAKAADLGQQPAIIAKAPIAAVHDRFFFSLEGGYWLNNSGANLTFDPTDAFLAGLPPLKPGHNGDTFAAALGSTIGPRWDWAVGYRYNWFGTASESLTQNLPPGPGPGTLTASASNRFWYQTFDAEVGYRPPAWQAAGVRLFVGPRVLNAHNAMNFDYNELVHAAPFGDFSKLGNFEHDVDLWGVGPRAGLQASVPLAAMPAPVSLEMSGSASAIFSRTTHNSAFSFNNQNFPFGTTGSGVTSTSTSPTIYNLEGSVGLSYRVAKPVAVELGYQAHEWWRLNTTVTTANSQGQFVEGRSDVLSHGPFAKITAELP
jgi:hypothetical protein